MLFKRNISSDNNLSGVETLYPLFLSLYPRKVAGVDRNRSLCWLYIWSNVRVA